MCSLFPTSKSRYKRSKSLVSNHLLGGQPNIHLLMHTYYPNTTMSNNKQKLSKELVSLFRNFNNFNIDHTRRPSSIVDRLDKFSCFCILATHEYFRHLFPHSINILTIYVHAKVLKLLIVSKASEKLKIRVKIICNRA